MQSGISASIYDIRHTCYNSLPKVLSSILSYIVRILYFLFILSLKILFMDGLVPKHFRFSLICLVFNFRKINLIFLTWVIGHFLLSGHTIQIFHFFYRKYEYHNENRCALCLGYLGATNSVGTIANLAFHYSHF